MLQEHGLKTICPLTIYHWLKKLGFVYEPRKNGYYVDGHERPLTVEYLSNFIKWYLTYERQMYQWIQITQYESKALKPEGLVMPNSGYQYRTKEGTDMVEYHVDSLHLSEERMRRETSFGGQLSVQREPNVDN